MIGLDTNILLRYLVQDDPVQSPLATHLIERKLTVRRPGYLSIVAISETVWTLERHYAVPSVEISKMIQTLATSQRFVLQHAKEVLYALSALEAGFGFADALVSVLGNKAGCSTTYTFDRKASRLPGFTLLS